MSQDFWICVGVAVFWTLLSTKIASEFYTNPRSREKLKEWPYNEWPLWLHVSWDPEFMRFILRACGYGQASGIFVFQESESTPLAIATGLATALATLALYRKSLRAAHAAVKEEIG